MGKYKLDIIKFCKIFDLFEEAEKQTLYDANVGRYRESTIEEHMYDFSKTKKQYADLNVNMQV